MNPTITEILFTEKSQLIIFPNILWRKNAVMLRPVTIKSNGAVAILEDNR